MAITPNPGYKVDPANPNGVVADPSYVPSATPPPTQQPGTPAAPQQPPTPPAPTSDPNAPSIFGATPPVGAQMQFSQMMQGALDRIQSNNQLSTQRQLLIKHLYDQPLTPQELQQLPQGAQDAIASGDKSNIEMQLRLMNDSISGRNNTLNQSVQYLTQGYQASVKDAEDQRSNALSSIQSFVTQYGSNAPEVMKSLFGQGYMDQLKSMGIDVASMSNMPTVAETRYGAQYGIPSGNSAFNITMNQGTIGSKTNNLLGIKLTPTTTGMGGSSSGIMATDGGEFASFATPQDSLNAGVQLLKLPLYQNLTLDQALKKWSNNAYGAAVAPDFPANTRISTLSDAQLMQVVTDIANNGEKIGTVSAQSQDIPIGPPDPATANSKNAGIAAGTDNTPNGIYQGALEYALTGKLPAIGLGSSASVKQTRNQIISLSGGLAASAGVSLPELQAEYSSMRSAQQNSTKQYVQTNINAQTAEGYFNTIQQLATTMDATTFQTISPLLNKWIRTGEVQTTGDPAVNNFMSALTEGLTEYAKVVSGQTSGAGVTVAANEQAQTLLDRGLSSGSINSWISSVAKPFMQTRLSSYQSGLSGVSQNILDFLTVSKGGQSGTVTSSPIDLGGGTTGGPPGTGSSDSSALPPDIESKVTSALTWQDSNTAILPRSVWSTLGANMDVLLAEMKKNGVTLLIQ